jgi:hypothetical protein
MDADTGKALTNYTADLITVDATTGDIRVSPSKPVGNYQVKVIGTLPDLTVTHKTIKINIKKYIPPASTYFTPTYTFQIDLAASNRT